MKQLKMTRQLLEDKKRVLKTKVSDAKRQRAQRKRKSELMISNRKCNKTDAIHERYSWTTTTRGLEDLLLLQQLLRVLIANEGQIYLKLVILWTICMQLCSK